MRANFKDSSGVITAAGVSQNILSAHVSRSALVIQNPPAETATLFINFGSPASDAGGSFSLPPGAMMFFDNSSFIPTEAIYAFSSQAGHKFTLKEG